MSRTQQHFIEQSEDGNWQSVFPESDADLSQTHSTKEEALAYFAECGVLLNSVTVLAKIEETSKFCAEVEVPNDYR
jgi:hypothetical protein